MVENKAELAALLIQYREAARDEELRTQRALAAAIQISPSFLSYLENANDKRLPNRHTINDLADVLALTDEDRNKLLTAAGFKQLEAKNIADEISKTLRQLDLDDREIELLVRELKAYASRWKRKRDTRKHELTKVAIIAAGWQARLLAPEKFERTILHAAEEAFEASIHDIVVVIAPTKSIPKFESLHDLAKKRKVEVSLQTVVQEEALGLGHAILQTRSSIGDDPFAVILPGDVDPSQAAIKEMKLCYGKPQVQKPMIAVTLRSQVAPAEFQHYGLATLGLKGPGKDSRLYFVDSMEEKPRTQGSRGPNDRSIMGRYILTPDIFEVLERTPRNNETKKIELTDALNTFIKEKHLLCAYELKQELLSLGTLRALTEMLIDSIGQRHKLPKMIAITRKALEDAEKEVGKRRR